MHPARRNLPAGKRNALACRIQIERIIDVAGPKACALGEISLLFQIRRNRRLRVHSRADAESFIGRVKEQPVLHQRPAERAAELVLPVRWG